MCRKCFNRSAIVIAAIFAGTEIPPEGPETKHEDDPTAPWDGKVIDALRALVADMAKASQAPEGTVAGDFGLVVDGLNASELLSLSGLAKALSMHFGSLSKLTAGEFGERITSGDQDAIEVSGKVATPAGELAKALIGLVVVNAGQQVPANLDLAQMAEEAAGRQVGPNLN